MAGTTRISVVFEYRPDGGLRAYSADVPGFILSHADAAAVLSDVQPALETILGEMMGRTVHVTPADPETALPWLPQARRREYLAQVA